MAEYKSAASQKRAMSISTHGMSSTRLYKTFHGMKQRCYNENNPSYPNYGGRGIKICQEWLDDFATFASWAMENGWDESKGRNEQTIDRIDVNGDYSPENCRFIPMSEQYYNRTDSHYITIDGETKLIKEWSDISGIPMTVINYRIRKFGWDSKKAVFQPRRKMSKRIGDITFNEETHSLTEWANIIGLDVSTLSSRFRRGDSIEEAISSPLKRHYKKQSNGN